MKKSVSFVSILFINFLIYGFNTLFGSLLPPYFNARFSPTVAGVLLSLGPIVAIFSPLLWGGISDRAKNKNRVLMLLVAGATLFFLLISTTLNLPLLALYLIATMFFMAPFGGLVDLLTLNACEQIQKPYGPCRVLGTLGFGVVALLGDLLMAGNDRRLFPLALAVGVLSLISLQLMPQHTAPTLSRRKVEGGVGYFKNKALVVLTVIIALAQFTWAYYSNFCGKYLTETLGAPDGIWGTVVLVTVLSEIPFFLFFKQIFKRFSISALTWFSCFVLILRWLALGLVKDLTIILIVSGITGTFVTILTYCITVYIKEKIAPELQATTLNLLYALGMGVSKMLAGVAGGLLTEYFGFSNSILLCSGLMVVALLLALKNKKALG